MSLMICSKCARVYPEGWKECPNCEQPLSPQVQADETPDDPYVGKKFDERFQVLHRIGKGGMGSVYKATQLSMDRPVALKILHRNFATDMKAIKRFMQEINAASKLSHPNTITVFDYGQTDSGALYIAMELLPGQTLEAMLKQEATLPLDTAVNILTQVCNSLSEAHHLGVVHRDLKPDNIHVFEQFGIHEFVKVLDFGIAKMAQTFDGQKITAEGKVCGTPYYMSPEQVEEGEVDGRADIYAIGVVLYRMLSGTVPFAGSSRAQIMMKQVLEAPKPLHVTFPKLEIPREASQLVTECLAKRPEDRPQSTEELTDRLTRLSIVDHDVNRDHGRPMPQQLRKIIDLDSSFTGHAEPSPSTDDDDEQRESQTGSDGSEPDLGVVVDDLDASSDDLCERPTRIDIVHEVAATRDTLVTAGSEQPPKPRRLFHWLLVVELVILVLIFLILLFVGHRVLGSS